MLFKGEESCLQLDVVSYELPVGEGDPTSDDRNWLVLRAKWTNEDGEIIIDSNSCLLTYELSDMRVGLTVLEAGLKGTYESAFAAPYFLLAADAEDDGFRFYVSFFLPNTMDGEDTATVRCFMDKAQMKALIDELERLCAKFPDRP